MLVRRPEGPHRAVGRRPQTGDRLADPAPAKSETGHGTQKPLLAMQRPMENHSASPGDAVYDPFVGSGTTIIAAETIGRRCHAIEIDPVYVDIAVRRWEAHTGRVAQLEPRMPAEVPKGIREAA